jgi:hypothetical protein
MSVARTAVCSLWQCAAPVARALTEAVTVRRASGSQASFCTSFRQLHPPGSQAEAAAGCAGGGAARAAGGPAVERRQRARHRGDAGAGLQTLKPEMSTTTQAGCTMCMCRAVIIPDTRASVSVPH